MAKVWRGYRAIVVAGRRFRWACHFHYPIVMLSVSYAQRGHTWPPDTLLVRFEDQPERVLRVTWPACCGPILTPRLVRECIEESLQRGWPLEHRVLQLDNSEIPMATSQPNHQAIDLHIAAIQAIAAGQRPKIPGVRWLSEPS